MATKTISIDLEAYKRLRRHKKPTESFSDVIKRIVPKPFDAEAWLASVAKLELSAEAAEAIEEQIAQRRRPSTRVR